MSTLSVIMANYNHSRFIEEALDAILSQSYRPTEVIVVDDCSPDNSVEVIERFVQRDPIVRLYRNERNRGVAYSAERALSLASGDYIYSAAADDRVLPGLFEASMKQLAEHPGAALCCSDPAFFDDETGAVVEDRYRWSDKPRYFSPEELAEVISGSYIAGHTTVTKRSAVAEAGLLPELNWHCDWFMTHAMAFRYGICYVPEPMAMMRRQAESYSASRKRDPIQQTETLGSLLRVVTSLPYRDVLPYFVRSGVFAHFGEDVVKTFMSNPEHWNMETLMLLQFPLYHWAGGMSLARQNFQNALHDTVPAVLDTRTPRILSRCKRDGVKRIFFYGAGSHREAFLNVWKARDGLPVEGILVSEPNGAREFMEFPVVSARDFNPGAGDGIVLSSSIFEKQMIDHCKARWPDTPHYPVYFAG